MKKIFVLLFAFVMVFAVFACTTDPNDGDDGDQDTGPVEPRLLYYVDVGSCYPGYVEKPMEPYEGKTELAPEETASGIVLATEEQSEGTLLHSVTEQLYQADPVTGKLWGAMGKYMSRATDSIRAGYNTFRFASGDEPSENLESGLDKRVLGYKLEVENRTTKLRVRLGFFNQWEERNFSIHVNGDTIASNFVAKNKQHLDVFAEDVTGQLIDGKYFITITVSSLWPTASSGDPLLNVIIIETMNHQLVVL